MKFHEIFFASFPSKMYEWIAKLENSQGRCRFNKPIVWTPELVRKIEASEDKITHTVDHWLDGNIGGFITEFMVDMIVSYNEAEKRFLNGP